ncbi:MAG: response regulator [Chthoniobacteraceae bacterium]
MGRILIADDEPLIVKILANALRAKGHEVATANDGTEALETARISKPDLVISDVNMPGLDGFELARALHNERPETKCILMSGGTDFDDLRIRNRTQSLVLTAAFKKPFNVADFFAAIDRALEEPAALPR